MVCTASITGRRIDQTQGMKYVYMIRAGDAVKFGCSKSPATRFTALRPFLSVYGPPEFVGCVEGDHNDEAYALSLAQPYPGSTTREVRLASSVPDIAEIFPSRVCHRNPIGSVRETQTPAREPRVQNPVREIRFKEKGTTFYRVKELLFADIFRTHASIADEVGISRERVRQIAKALGDTGKDRIQVVKQLRFEQITKPPRGFHLAVRRWILESGSSYCTHRLHEGGRVVSPSEMTNNKYKMCQKCNAARMREAVHTNPNIIRYYKEYAKRPEVKKHRREYMKKWAEGKGGTAAIQRERYHRMMADPVKAAKYREKKRNYDAQRNRRNKNED